MTRWKEFAAEAPEFAERVRARFTASKHGTLATLRKDGSPRISGTEVSFDGGDLWLGSMPGAVKELDLRRDPRLALHCPTEDAPEANPSTWAGDAKIAGTAHEDEPHRFRIDLTEVVLTRVGDPADHLVIETWHPGRGLQRLSRR